MKVRFVKRYLQRFIYRTAKDVHWTRSLQPHLSMSMQCIRSVSRRLLQRCPGMICAESDDRQVATSVEHCGSKKFDQDLSWLLYTELHWLDVPEWVKYKLSSQAVYMDKRRSTCSTCVIQPLMSHHSDISDPPVKDWYTYRVADGIHLPNGLSQWLARWLMSNSLPDNLRDPAIMTETLSANT